MALPLAPRENMALTLADSFLNDLDELDEAAEEEEEEEEEESRPAKVARREEESKMASVARLRRSARYKEHMIAVEEGSGDAYEIVVASNDILAKIETETTLVFEFVRSLYSKRFPELETLLPSKIEYAQVVERIGNHVEDVAKVDLSGILAPSVAMVVTVTGSTTSGSSLQDQELRDCLEGCEEIAGLERDKATVLAFVESKMADLAPNVTALLNSSGLAAMLVGMAGGLQELARVPACNLTVMGQRGRQDLAGFGSIASRPHTGVLFFCDLVQTAPAFLQRRALKMVAAKTALAARVDAFDRTEAGNKGKALREEIRAKLDKLQQPERAPRVKALPAPDIMSGKKKRGGRRVRNAKDRIRMTEMRSLANKRAFGVDASDEYGDDAMGNDFGLLSADTEGGSLRAPKITQKKQTMITKRKMVALSSGATNGLSSSLVFTPVQGIELANPNAAAAVQQANDRWFSDNSGFQSALPAAPPNLGPS